MFPLLFFLVDVSGDSLFFLFFFFLHSQKNYTKPPKNPSLPVPWHTISWIKLSREPYVTGRERERKKFLKKNQSGQAFLNSFFFFFFPRSRSGSVWIITTRLEKRHGDSVFPLSFPETMGGTLTNRKKAVCLWVTGYVTIPTRLPDSRNVLQNQQESSRMITGRCGTWCTKHLRNGPACVISLLYGSIKHFYY